MDNTVVPPSCLAPELIASFAHACFGLSADGSTRKLTGLSESVVWRFSVNHDAWFMKIYSPHQSTLADVVDEANLYRYLATCGLHAPAIRASKRGDFVEALRVGNDVYPVMVMKSERLRTTRPSTVARDEMVAISRTVAQLHTVVGNYPFLDRAKVGQAIDTRDLWIRTGHSLKTWGQHLARAARALSKRHSDQLETDADTSKDSHTTQALAALRKRLAAIELGTHDLPAALRRTLIHGDMALHHAPFLSNGDVYLFDFADRSWSPIIDELAILAAHLYTAEDISLARWEQLKEWMFQGYSSVSTITAEDYNAFRAALLRRLIDEIDYLFAISIVTATPFDRNRIERRYRLAKILSEHRGERASNAGDDK